MINYIKRMFSWGGYAGRREFLGFYVLPFGLFPLFVILPLLLFTWLDWSVGVGFKLWVVVVMLLIGVLSICAAARRLRHLGWPVGLTFLQLIPALNALVYVAEFILILMPSQKDVREETPAYLWCNLCIGIGGFLLPILLVAGMVLFATQAPSSFIKLLPQKQREATQSSLAAKTVSVPREIPPEIMVPVEKAPVQLARTKPLPMTLPAPKWTVIADRVQWQGTVSCDETCTQTLPQAAQCREYVSADQLARLCVFLVNKPNQPFEYHQVLIAPSRHISEYITFNYQFVPELLGHFKDGQLKELFYNFSENKVFFFYLTREGFVPDFSNRNHLPTQEHANISIALLSPDTWAPADFQANGSYSEGNPRKLSTPWTGFKVSDRWVRFAKI